MQPLNPSRFIYSLTGRLLDCDWTETSIKTLLLPSAMEYPLRVPGLANRPRQAFADKPVYQDLARFLLHDVGLSRALARSIAMLHVSKSKGDLTPPRLRSLSLPDLPNEAALAKWFGIDSPHLRWRADISGRNRKHREGPLRTYRHRWIPRRHGFPRLLEIPKRELKAMQRKILVEILNQIPAHPAAHGFVVGRSIVSNASAHCGKAAVLRFDLTDFFPSVSAARVSRIFRTIGCSVDVARLLMGLCTTSLPADVWNDRPGARDGSDFLLRQRLITRHLPQGAPTSPALANLAANRLDRQLSVLAKHLSVTYTRYADDLTFSGEDDLARNRKRLATLVAVIADEEGFSLNHRKTRLMRAGVCQQVTGVVVNVRPNINRVEFDRLKAILTNCVRHGPGSQNKSAPVDFRAHLGGKVSQAMSVNPVRGQKLLAMFERISWS